MVRCYSILDAQEEVVLLYAGMTFAASVLSLSYTHAWPVPHSFIVSSVTTQEFHMFYCISCIRYLLRQVYCGRAPIVGWSSAVLHISVVTSYTFVNMALCLRVFQPATRISTNTEPQ